MTDDDDDDCCGLLASVWRVKLSNGREEVCQVDVALRSEKGDNQKLLSTVQTNFDCIFSLFFGQFCILSLNCFAIAFNSRKCNNV